MKTTIPLIGSVVLNLALAGYILSRPGTTASPPPTAALAESASAPTDGKTPAPITPTTGPAMAVLSATNAAGKTFDWRAVESEDYRKYIANLRAIGCPEETIRDIIVADVNKLYGSRRAASLGTNRFQFWKTGNPLADLLDEKRLAQQQESARERRGLLKELLGTDVPDKPEAAAGATYEALFDFVPAEKQGELIDHEHKYAARLMNTMKDAQRGNTTETRKVLAEKDAELTKLLTPEQKEEYDLRLSQTAVVMRLQMSEFEPTEQEFRDIFKLRKKLEDEFGVPGMQSTAQEERERRTAAEKEVDGQIRSVLGDGRYLEYKYSDDLARSSLKDIVAEHNVPRESALKVFDVQQVAQDHARTVRADQSLTAEQRKTALNAIRAETEKELGQFLPQNALRAYVEKGSWIKGLNK